MNHIDCKYFLAADVFKGICKKTKDSISADDSACSEFENVPKCKRCKNYSEDGINLGYCKDQFSAYPEMLAVTCKDFEWI